MRTIKRLVDSAKDIVTSVVTTGDYVIDATMGNGNDTLLLAKLVGNTGKVYSFDIQKEAIENTKNKLASENLLDNAELIHDSHENIKKYINKKVKFAMFNLGFLPGGDHNIVTNPDSTISALNSIMDILEVGGIITIIIYYGHTGGVEEKDAVLNFVSCLESSNYLVQKIEMLNCKNSPPILIVIERVK